LIQELLGLSLCFGLSAFLTYVIDKDMSVRLLLILFMIFSILAVFVNLLPFWVFDIDLLVLSILIFQWIMKATNFSTAFVWFPFITFLLFAIFGAVCYIVYVSSPATFPVTNYDIDAVIGSYLGTTPTTNVNLTLFWSWNFITGLILTLVGVALIGLRILGSGLGEQSTHILTTATIYAGAFFMFYPECQIGLGFIPFLSGGLFILLSVLYTVGALSNTIFLGGSGGAAE
jgi:hypothetical protein